MEPKFVTRDQFTVVGMEYNTKQENMEFSRLFGQFFERIGEVTNQSKPGACYAICSCGPECDPENGVCKCNENGFMYMPCVEVSDAEHAPSGMKARTFPALKYAVFTHKGPMHKMGETYNYIFQTWMPNSGCKPTGGFCFEYYDSRSENAQSEDCEMDIYMPVK